MDELIVRVEDADTFFSRVGAEMRRLDQGVLMPAPASVSFTGMPQLLDVLSKTRWALLSKLRATGPASIRALAKALGRDYRGVHSDVRRLLDVGLIEKDETGRVLVPWSKITAEVHLDKAA